MAKVLFYMYMFRTHYVIIFLYELYTSSVLLALIYV